jgi:hypothetical protein
MRWRLGICPVSTFNGWKLTNEEKGVKPPAPRQYIWFPARKFRHNTNFRRNFSRNFVWPKTCFVSAKFCQKIRRGKTKRNFTTYKYMYCIYLSMYLCAKACACLYMYVYVHVTVQAACSYCMSMLHVLTSSHVHAHAACPCHMSMPYVCCISIPHVQSMPHVHAADSDGTFTYHILFVKVLGHLHS